MPRLRKVIPDNGEVALAGKFGSSFDGAASETEDRSESKLFSKQNMQFTLCCGSR